MTFSSSYPTPSPLRYQREIVEYLKAAEPELWKWASSVEALQGAADSMRTEMLKTNYRLDSEGHPELVRRCAAVAERLEITVPITLYQSTSGGQANAGLCHSPGEVHIVFSGPILATLKEDELDAVMAHELAHFRLWEMDNGDYLVADRLLLSAANDVRSSPCHRHTARRFRLYTEIFADRGALAGCGALETTVAALVKTETGLSHVSAASYLRQADEIFADGNSATKGIDHPETFIRARALRMWSEKNSELESWLTQTIEGPHALDELDLIGQRRATDLTRRLLGQLLRPKWFQSPATLAHARAFFPDFTPAAEADPNILAELASKDGPTRDYLGYLLLDFAVADPELDDVPLANALGWADRLGIAAEFDKLIAKELRVGKRQLSKLKKEAESRVRTAEGAA